MSNPFGIDGKALMNTLMRAEADKSGNKFIVRLIDVFQKYNLSLVDGMGLLTEVMAVVQSEHGEGD